MPCCRVKPYQCHIWVKGVLECRATLAAACVRRSLHAQYMMGVCAYQSCRALGRNNDDGDWNRATDRRTETELAFPTRFGAQPRSHWVPGLIGIICLVFCPRLLALSFPGLESPKNGGCESESFSPLSHILSLALSLSPLETSLSLVPSPPVLCATHR